MSDRMKGVIIRVLPNRGFGFIRDSDGRSRFMHAQQVKPAGTFDMLREGMSVDFLPADGGPKADGLRALDIRVVD